MVARVTHHLDTGEPISAEAAWSWVERWDRQQERYLPYREARFRAMLDAVDRVLTDQPPRLLDLCCGNGAISRRALSRWPAATITAVDMDPLHLELGRRTLGDQVEWRDTDIRQDGWDDGLTPAGFDAVLSSTAIHWLRRPDVVSLYGRIARLLRPGGLFINADHLPVDEPLVAKLSATILTVWQADRLHDAEDHAGFHAAANRLPGLAGHARTREQRFADKPPGDELPLSDHRAILLANGFREAGEIWRVHTDAILVAVPA
jgi:trans-aconitate methyltransferase